jgi:hypothetical protein
LDGGREGYFRGDAAKANLDKLEAIRVGGDSCRMTFTAFGEIWVS